MKALKHLEVVPKNHPNKKREENGKKTPHGWVFLLKSKSINEYLYSPTRKGGWRKTEQKHLFVSMKLSNQLHHKKSSHCQLSFRWQVISIYQQRASWQGDRNDNLAWTVNNIFSRTSKAEMSVHAWGHE